ncbi:14234_t:CDS:1, partial [Rhizophagus irregularis]
MKTKISDLSKNKKPRKNTVPKNNGNQSSGVLPIQSNEQVLQSVK